MAMYDRFFVQPDQIDQQEAYALRVFHRFPAPCQDVHWLWSCGDFKEIFRIFEKLLGCGCFLCCFFLCEELFHTLGDPSLPAQVDFSRSYVDLWPGFGFAEVVSHVKETCSQKKRCELHHAFCMLDVHLLSKFALRQETEEHTVLRVPRIYLLLLSLKDPWKSSNYQQVAATVWVSVWKWQLSLCIASGAPRQARWAANTDDLRHVDSGDGILATRFPITVTVDYGCHDVPPTPKKVPKRPSAP